MDELRNNFHQRDPDLEALLAPMLDVVFRGVPGLDQDDAWFGHFPFAQWMIQTASPRILVDLGGGVSYAAFCGAVRDGELATRCYAVGAAEGDDRFAERSRHDSRQFGAFSQLLRAEAVEAAGSFTDASVDVLHVGGLHSYEVARRIVDAWLPKLSSRAVVLFDHTNERGAGAGVWRLWEELAERWPAFEFAHSRGLGVLCVGVNAPGAILGLCSLSPDEGARLRARFAFLGKRWEAEARAEALGRQVAECERRIARLQQAAHVSGVQAGVARQALAKLQAEIGASADAVAAAQAAAHNAAQARSAAEQNLRRAGEGRTSELSGLKAELARLEHERDQVLNSTVWRLTRPFRRCLEAVPVPMRRPVRRAARVAWWLATPWKTQARVRFFRQRRSLAAPGPTLALTSALPPRDAYADWIQAFESVAPQRTAARPLTTMRFSLLLLQSGSEEATLATLRSVRNQASPDWQIVLAATPDLSRMLASGPADRRVAVVDAPDGERGSVLATLLARAEGHWVGVLDAGDILAADALDQAAAALDDAPGAAVLYGDEDVLTAGGQRTAPQFKPEWSPEALHGYNYLGRLTLLSRELAQAAGGFTAGDGAGAEWSLNLRATDLAQRSGRGVIRLPRVLCHTMAGPHRQRPPPGSADAADHRAVLASYWARRGMMTPAVQTQTDGTQRSSWELASPPFVSIIIPNRNSAALLGRCLKGLLEQTSYQAFEIVIVENHSTDAATWALYDAVQRGGRVRIVHFSRPFNYSAVCNHGAASARGSLLLFLNNDVEIVDPGWLGELVRVAGLPGVGVVGAKLRYPGGEMQHGGVAVGIHLFGLLFHRCREDEWGVFGSPNTVRNCAAVMGACQMVSRTAFDHIGGFDEAYQIANSDVALCLRASRLGYRTVYTPFATLVHHEGATRGRTNPAADMARSARELSRFGITADPFLHPGLSGQDPVPRLRSPGEPDLRDTLAAQAASYLAAVPGPAAELDLFDDGAVLEAAEAGHAGVFWHSVPAAAAAAAGADAGSWALARWVLDLLRSRSDLRARFPQALSEGPGGAFAAWLAADADGMLDAAAGAVEALFRQDPALRPRQIYFWREDVREQIPLGLLPPGRRALAVWMFRHGMSEHGLRLEEVWWFLLSCAEDPAAELVRTYRFTAPWQQGSPHGLTVFGRSAFAAWLAERYGVHPGAAWLRPAAWPVALSDAEQIRLAYAAIESWRVRHPAAFGSVAAAAALMRWLASAEAGLPPELRGWCAARLLDATVADLVRPGVTVIGHYCYPSGLRVSVEAMSDAMDAAGVAVDRRDLRTEASDDPYHYRFDGLETHDVTIIHTQPEPFFKDAYRRADLGERSPRSYRIGYWYWELEAVPPFWDDVARGVDEIWTATAFVADALRRVVSVPVHTLFPGVRIGAFTPRPREALGAPARADGRFAFLFSFHMASITERKNPFALIGAFKLAFRPEDKADLVLKTTHAPRHAVELAALHAAAAGANITIIDRVFTSDETLSLMDGCDAYVSLHRAEGLGLTMAEAMLLGKPVIATGYSGNLEFMDDDNSLLVDCSIVPLGRSIPPYDAAAVWAEPSVEHAAALMRRVFDNQAWAAELGLRGQADARRRMSQEAAGRRFTERLLQIKHRPNA